MKNLTKEWEIFDFTDAEAKVVHAFLEGGTQSVSALARRAALPRSTVDDVLKRLGGRRLVRKVSKGYASVWRLVRSEKIERELDEAAESLGIGDIKKDIEEEFGVQISGTTEVVVYRGMLNILKIYEHLFKELRREERIFAIETPEALRGFMSNIPPSRAVEFSQFITDRNVIIEAVFPESIKDAYREFAQENPDWPRSFTPRTQAVRLVPNELLPGTMELIIFGDRVTIANYKEEVLVLVQNEEMIMLFRALYRLMYEAGKPFDQNAFIQDLAQ